MSKMVLIKAGKTRMEVVCGTLLLRMAQLVIICIKPDKDFGMPVDTSPRTAMPLVAFFCTATTNLNTKHTVAGQNAPPNAPVSYLFPQYTLYFVWITPGIIYFYSDGTPELLNITIWMPLKSLLLDLNLLVVLEDVVVGMPSVTDMMGMSELLIAP